MGIRRELIEATRQRYQQSIKSERIQILEEFVGLTGYHRKHAIRVLNGSPAQPTAKPSRRARRRYGERIARCLISLWEAADRICAKRLKALLPTLIDSLERHGHLQLGTQERTKLAAISAATIDRLLEPHRRQLTGGVRRRGGVGNAIMRAVPIRTFADWKDPVPGYFEVDFVEHCGGWAEGQFVHTLVLTDVATGWTECVALPFREQLLVVKAITSVRERLPFTLRGLDTDNDTAFMNEVVAEFMNASGLVFTRSRAYKKNDQAWVEQKNGAIVRKLAGYERLQGSEATANLARLYEASRLYVNFFQPSMKLKSKTRRGAYVSKKYDTPQTPAARLIASGVLGADTCQGLLQQLRTLDPIELLTEIREAQRTIFRERPIESQGDTDLGAFLLGLRSAWHERPPARPNRRKPERVRDWRSRADPFEHVWPELKSWLEQTPHESATKLLSQLRERYPGVFPARQLPTLQRRVQAWKRDRLRELILGAAIAPAGEASPAAAIQGETTTINE